MTLGVRVVRQENTTEPDSVKCATNSANSATQEPLPVTRVKRETIGHFSHFHLPKREVEDAAAYKSDSNAMFDVDDKHVESSRSVLAEEANRVVSEGALRSAIVESAADAIIGMTRDGVIVSWNNGASDLYGYEAKEAVGRSLSLFTPLDRLDELLHLIEQIRSERPLLQYESVHLRKGGKHIPVFLTISPIRNSEGNVAGASAIVREIVRPDQSEIELRHANEKLIAVVNTLKQRNREMNLVQQLNTLLQTCMSPGEAYAIIEQSLQKLFPSGAGALFEWNASLNLLEARAKWGDSRLGEMVFGPDECWALRRGQIYQVSEWGMTLPCPHLASLTAASFICAPLVASGETSGILTVQGSPYELSQPKNVQERIFASRQLLVETVASQIALALANLRLRETLRAQSIRDPVSGLFNRRYLDETLPREIHRADREGKSLGIIMGDLDSFKTFNDTHGHPAGDSLLRVFGDLIRKLVRAGDIACRYGGDEFVLILSDVSLGTSRLRAELLQREFRHLVVQSGDVFLDPGTISLGISSFPIDGKNAESLLRVADEALYRAKAKGGGQIELSPGLEPSKL